MNDPVGNIWDEIHRIWHALGDLGTERPPYAAGSWIPDSDPWVYVSATSFKIVGKDVRSRFGVSTRLKYNDGSTDYGTVYSSALSGSDTVVSLAQNTDYSIANAALSNCYYSYGNPPDYPFWFNYVPVWSTTGAAPSLGNGSLTGKFFIEGREVCHRIELTAGNTTTFGTGAWLFTLAVNQLSYVLGTVWFLESTETIGGVRGWASGQLIGLYSGGAVDATHPYAWADGNRFSALVFSDL